MKTLRVMLLGAVTMLLVSGFAGAALAQDDADLCDEYPIGECLDEVVEEGDASDVASTDDAGSSDDSDEAVITRNAPNEEPQVLGTTLALTGTNTALLIGLGIVLALVGGGTLTALRRRSGSNA